jgi:hypothetical protein
LRKERRDRDHAENRIEQIPAPLDAHQRQQRHHHRHHQRAGRAGDGEPAGEVHPPHRLDAPRPEAEERQKQERGEEENVAHCRT